MKKVILFLTAVIVVISNANAQAVIARQHNGQTRFHYLTAPYTGAQIQNVIDTVTTLPGDTLYLPGVTFTFEDQVVVNQRLVIIGTGVNPDSLSAVNGVQRTTFWSHGAEHFKFSSATPGASGSELHGILFSGDVGLLVGQNEATENVSNLKIYRCEFANLLSLNSGNGLNAGEANNVLIDQCVVRSHIGAAEATNLVVSNCILMGELKSAIAGTQVRNNIILNYSHLAPGNGSASSGVNYERNIFTKNQSTQFNVTEQSVYNNNLWVFNEGGSVNLDGTVSQSNNPSTVIITNANLFTGLDPLVPLNQVLTTFSYRSNYRLNPQNNSYATYMNMDGIGNPVGLWYSDYTAPSGTVWKEGVLPFNPHWQQFSNGILGTQNGNLNVHIKAAAQQE